MKTSRVPFVGIYERQPLGGEISGGQLQMNLGSCSPTMLQLNFWGGRRVATGRVTTCFLFRGRDIRPMKRNDRIVDEEEDFKKCVFTVASLYVLI